MALLQQIREEFIESIKGMEHWWWLNIPSTSLVNFHPVG